MAEATNVDDIMEKGMVNGLEDGAQIFAVLPGLHSRAISSTGTKFTSKNSIETESGNKSSE